MIASPSNAPLGSNLNVHYNHGLLEWTRDVSNIGLALTDLIPIHMIQPLGPWERGHRFLFFFPRQAGMPGPSVRVVMRLGYLGERVKFLRIPTSSIAIELVERK
jgi:hypothetical protein